MSQSAFSAVLVGVTALLRRPSLPRGRGCGWRALASAASRSDFAARGFGFVASRLDFIAYGFGLRRLLRWVRCFSLRLGCPGLRPSPLAALSSLLVVSARLLLAPTWLLVASAWLLLVSTRLLAALSLLLMVSTSLLMASAAMACCAGFAASRFGLAARVSAFVACRAGFAASRFGFVAYGFDFRRLPPPLPTRRKLTGRADHTHTSFTSKH